MEYVYAALLLHKLKQDITEDNITNIIKSAGATPNEVKVKALVAALSEVNIEEALKSAPVATANIASSATPPPSTETKAEEEKKDEKKEEEALEGLSALFG
jgi:large subunit ribosomal protein L12